MNTPPILTQKKIGGTCPFTTPIIGRIRINPPAIPCTNVRTRLDILPGKERREMVIANNPIIVKKKNGIRSCIEYSQTNPNDKLKGITVEIIATEELRRAS
jgi:hypothetical protein